MDALNLGLGKVLFLYGGRLLRRPLKALLIFNDGRIESEHALLKSSRDFHERFFAGVATDFSIEKRVPEIHDQFGIRSCGARLFQISRRRDTGRGPGPEAPS